MISNAYILEAGDAAAGFIGNESPHGVRGVVTGTPVVAAVRPHDVPHPTGTNSAVVHDYILGQGSGFASVIAV